MPAVTLNSAALAGLSLEFAPTAKGSLGGLFLAMISLEIRVTDIYAVYQIVRGAEAQAPSDLHAQYMLPTPQQVTLCNLDLHQAETPAMGPRTATPQDMDKGMAPRRAISEFKVRIGPDLC